MIHVCTDLREAVEKSIADKKNDYTLNGDADFAKAGLTTTGRLKEIWGNADFKDSLVESLGKLRHIGKSAYFGHSKIKSLGKLKNICLNGYFAFSSLESLGELETIGGCAFFSFPRMAIGFGVTMNDNSFSGDPKIISSGKLTLIGENVFISKSKIKLLDNVNVEGNIIGT